MWFGWFGGFQVWVPVWISVVVGFPPGHVVVVCVLLGVCLWMLVWLQCFVFAQFCPICVWFSFVVLSYPVKGLNRVGRVLL